MHFNPLNLTLAPFVKAYKYGYGFILQVNSYCIYYLCIFL